MTQEQIESAQLAVRKLARTVMIGVRCAGGTIKRGDLVKAFAPFDWKPTRGELSDAIDYLVGLGHLNRKSGPLGYYDMSDCELSCGVHIPR